MGIMEAVKVVSSGVLELTCPVRSFSAFRVLAQIQ